jgi:ATP-dependent DNA helicase RecG
VNKALNFVLEHTLLSAWLVPGKAEREERNEYPSDAIREAIVNAICHRDYESTGNVQVRIFDDRIEVWNPGSLPEGWTVEKLKQKHESIPKNPLIADQFFLIKFIEKWGTGTIEMVRRCVEWGLVRSGVCQSRSLNLQERV